MLTKRLCGLFFVLLMSFMHHGLIAMSNAAEIAPQISDQRGIKVSATLQTPTADAQIWNVEVTLETHTQALSDDLTKSATLVVDGRQYPPLAWDGAPPGGHHRKGVLRFKAIAPQPNSIALQIRLSGEKSPRSFKWLLK